jgi:hypothetical protein
VVVGEVEPGLGVLGGGEGGDLGGDDAGLAVAEAVGDHEAGAGVRIVEGELHEAA